MQSLLHELLLKAEDVAAREVGSDGGGARPMQIVLDSIGRGTGVSDLLCMPIILVQ